LSTSHAVKDRSRPVRRDNNANFFMIWVIFCLLRLLRVEVVEEDAKM
jgi:hypothetical protein